MAQNVIINGVTYANVPQVDIPLSGGGTAHFFDTTDGDAVAGDLLSGKVAFNGSGEITGSMPNNGNISGNITGVAQSVTIPAGYVSGGTVQIDAAEQAKIITGNIKAGTTILGVSGKSTVKDVADTTAVAGVVLSGYAFYGADGTKVNGNLAVPTISQDSVTGVLSIV